jgi:DNA-binding CsgD family transcriptional regulator
MLVQERHPRLIKELQQMNLSRSELQMCLLSAIDLRQKQVATLLGISPQNLRNQRLRLLARITGRQADSVADFNEWIEGMKA